ncbi:(2Fe-2S)-binding protein [Candidatus Poriferisocius sp.]|uniref:(2Fe-2S)-binding protein n=1 Tax=Candidatus Poriferisocius sp. TaxID=3101276 RepID=UPI003B5973CF
MRATQPVRLRANGVDYTGEAEPRTTLADFLRRQCGLTGTHVGCEHGVCGTCTLLVDGAAVRSCLLLAVQADGCEVTTIEGLADNSDRANPVLGPVQQAFADAMSFQCGFCTPGIVMSTVAWLDARPEGSDAPTDHEIREFLAGTLCRCTGYTSIVEGVRLAAARYSASEASAAAP